MTHNEHTGDLITNTKGSAEKYAQGWDGLFGSKVEKISEVRIDGVPMEIGHFMVGDSCVEPMMVDDSDVIPMTNSQQWWRDAYARMGELGFLDPESVKTFRGLCESGTFTAEAAHKAFAGLKRKEPTVVRALDFHDRLKPGANFFPNNTIYADNNGNAIMSSGRIPLYQDPSHNG